MTRHLPPCRQLAGVTNALRAAPLDNPVQRHQTKRLHQVQEQQQPFWLILPYQGAPDTAAPYGILQLR